jgi:hypothetical protein
MRRRLSLVVAVLILLTFVSAVLAEPKPTNVPHMVKPGEASWPAAWGAIGTQWADMTGAAELPAGVMAGEFEDGSGDEFIRGPVPIGFTFHFMNGPVEPVPGWPPAECPASGCTTLPCHGAELPEDWPVELTDEGYEMIYVADNGYLVVADPQYLAQVKDLDFVIQDPNIGTNGHYYSALGPQRPNNYIAPFWSDWVIGDNTTHKVVSIKKIAVKCPPQKLEAVDAPNGQICYEWVPDQVADGERPRGRLLFKTVGEAPNRVFVVEWQNARNYSSGNLVSFQAQLFEGSNAILFQYKDAMPEDDSRPFFQFGGVIGIEDSFGQTYVGQSFQAGVQSKYNPYIWTPAPAPVSDGDQIGFVY